MSQSGSIHTSLHDTQTSSQPEQLDNRMHFDRSMVAQLGNVPQPEQLGSTGSGAEQSQGETGDSEL